MTPIATILIVVTIVSSYTETVPQPDYSRPLPVHGPQNSFYSIHDDAALLVKAGNLVNRAQKQKDRFVSASLYFQAGRHYEKAQQNEKALAAYQKAVDLSNRNSLRDLAISSQMNLIKQQMESETDDFTYCGNRSPRQTLKWLEKIYANNPTHRNVDEVFYFTGLWYEQRSRMLTAQAYYERIWRLPKESAWAERAMFADVRSKVRVFGDTPRDAGKGRDAKSLLDSYLTIYPDSRRTDAAMALKRDIDESLAGQAFDVAVFYEKIAGNTDAALFSYQQLIDDFPGTEKAGEAVLRMEKIAATQRVGIPEMELTAR